MLTKFAAAMTELRLDIAGANQGKLRVGVAVTVATLAVTASGWPPGDMFQRMLFWVLVAIPAGGVGLGLVVGELIQSRHDRLGALRADDREVQILRGRIADDLSRKRAEAE